MALERKSIHDRELHKFVESPTRPTEPAVDVFVSGGQVEINENGVRINPFGSASAVASGSTATILSYSVPALKALKVLSVIFGGNNIGKYEVKINGSSVMVLRTNFGGELHTSLNFNSIILNAADTITVEVTNNRPYAGDYESTLFGALLDV